MAVKAKLMKEGVCSSIRHGVLKPPTQSVVVRKNKMQTGILRRNYSMSDFEGLCYTRAIQIKVV